MEPWPFSHGNDKVRKRAKDLVKPSMEPWPFSHGNAGISGFSAQMVPFASAIPGFGACFAAQLSVFPLWFHLSSQ